MEEHREFIRSQRCGFLYHLFSHSFLFHPCTIIGGEPGEGLGTGDEESDAEHSDANTVAEEDKDRRTKRSRRSKSKISKQKMAEIQRMIEADRKKLEEEKDLALEERNKIQVGLFNGEVKPNFTT